MVFQGFLKLLLPCPPPPHTHKEGEISNSKGLEDIKTILTIWSLLTEHKYHDEL